MKQISILIAGIFFLKSSIAQLITKEQYIEQHKDFAIREMKRMGVPAAITLAQGILETECGNSELVKKSNNHFGIKCKSTWTSTGVSHDDDAPGECFRCYKDAEGSYRDHSNFLRGNDRYGFLFKLDPKDYKAWAYGLKKAGYATNPSYPKILIKNIEENNLQQYTLEAVNEVPVFDASKYTSDPEDKDFDKLTNANENNTEIKSTSFAGGSLQQFENKLIINGSAAVIGKKGMSLLALATENNINLSKLLEFNDLDKDGLLSKDQFIFLEKKSREGEKDFYILQKDETLYDVAQKNGIRLQSLYEYNLSAGNQKFIVGDRIKLRADITNLLAMNEKTKPSASMMTHSVQPKEGLYAISKKYGVTVTQIKEWNNLADDNIKVGQQLIISSK